MAAAHINYAEWVREGVMVHFNDGRSVFYPVAFLYEHRDEQALIADDDPLPRARHS